MLRIESIIRLCTRQLSQQTNLTFRFIDLFPKFGLFAERPRSQSVAALLIDPPDANKDRQEANGSLLEYVADGNRPQMHSAQPRVWLMEAAALT